MFKYPFFYSIVFASVNLLQAVVTFLMLGQYYPNWTVKLSCWNAKKKIEKKRKDS